MAALMTIKEAALYLNMSVSTINRKIKSGELRHIKTGSLVRFRMWDLDTYLDERTFTGFEERDGAAA